MRILFAGGGTGGHLYPGLAIARAVQRLRPDIQPYFIGARRGVERDILPGTGFPHVLLDLHPLYRARVWDNWRTVAGLLTAWRGIGRVVGEERPRLIVGTGGYAAGAALAYGVAHGIPIVEQTGDALPSLTARMFSRWAREVYLSFPESGQHLRVRAPDALVDTGAPIEPPPDPRPPRADALRAWRFPPDAIVVLVYGGSQGSLAINSAVRDWISGGLPDRVHLIWATGKKTFDEFAALERDRVRVRPYLSPIADAYAATNLSVARAGTMTLAELFAWHIPAILIPLPTAAADHQTKNAETLAAAGAAVHVPQSRLSGASLGAAVSALLDDPRRLNALAAAAAARARPHAAEEIARRIVVIADAEARPGLRT